MTDSSAHPRGNQQPMAAIGLRAHSGWAALVALEGTAQAPKILQRRRIELAGSAIAGAAQPYHTARSMPLPESAAFLDRCAAASHALAHNALELVVTGLSAQHYTLVGACILLGAGRTTASLAQILASHPAIHTAEGEFFRNALRSAGAACGLEVSGIKERDLFHHATATLRLPLSAIQRQLAEAGKSIGPPWTQDEKLSALAAWLILASSGNKHIRSPSPHPSTSSHL
jgi:hypothetical protein